MAGAMGDDRSKAIPLQLSWVGALCGALLLLLSDVLPVHLGFVRPGTLYICLTEVEVAFLLFAWPAYLSAAAPSPGRSLLDLGLLFLAALPLVLIAGNVSNISAGALLQTQAIPASLGAATAGVYALGRRRGWRVGPWHVLGVFLVSALLPFLAFVASPSFSWGSVISPFWAVASPGLLAPVLFAGVAAVLLSASALAGKGGGA